MPTKIIFEDSDLIIYSETYQTHWNPDKIGGAKTIVSKSALSAYSKEVMKNVQSLRQRD
jgi:hypothetical protein